MQNDNYIKATYNKISGWANKNAGWLILIGIIITIAAIIIHNVGKDYLGVERERCNDLAFGETMEKSYQGVCELYLGSDNKTHYVYHRYYHINDDKGEYFYINWETGKKGRY